MCKVIKATLLYQILSSIGNLLWFLAKNGSKSISFRLKFDDISVTLSLIVLSWIFVQTHRDAILLHTRRMNVIFGKLGQFMLSGGRGGGLPPLALSLCLILEAKKTVQIWKVFQVRMSS